MFLLLITTLIIMGIAYSAYPLIKSSISIGPFAFSLIVGLLTTCTLWFFSSSTNHKPKNSDSIIVGVSADFPPFSFLQDGVIVGFDIDIIKEIGHRINKKLELRNMPFETLLPCLQLGNIHVIASGITATPERAQHMLFTTPYLEDGPLVIVSLTANPAKTVADLYHKEVAVNEGYTADLYISKIKGPLIQRLKSPAQAFLALKTGRVFAFITAANTVKPFFDQYGNDLFHVAALPNTDENSCIAVAPHHPDLLKKIQHALDTMKQDGSLQQLRTKWEL